MRGHLLGPQPPPAKRPHRLPNEPAHFLLLFPANKPEIKVLKYKRTDFGDTCMRNAAGLTKAGLFRPFPQAQPTGSPARTIVSPSASYVKSILLKTLYLLYTSTCSSVLFFVKHCGQLVRSNGFWFRMCNTLTTHCFAQ